MKFVEQCKQYFGIPYAKKYQQPGSKISTCIYSNDEHVILIKHERACLTTFPNTETRVENASHHAVEYFWIDLWGVWKCGETLSWVLIYLVNWKQRGKKDIKYANKYRLLTKYEVKMAGYWPSSFFACLWTETESRSITRKKEWGQYPAILSENGLVNSGFLILLLGKFFPWDPAGSHKPAR